MDNVANKRQRDHVELDLRVDENDAIFSTDNHENENPRCDPRDHSRERDGDHDREDSNGRDPLTLRRDTSEVCSVEIGGKYI